ncbi:hypothetical protein KVR01_007943 [Diaporthe batatas]|uniref:uncharacterized protein n=1 Tax=Diaporthe batatas TaxID=748121 RepID=UPI001D04518E|nr:uncharacterized protein KVR01_007943 [Diaporthe batatas]KAG8162178.1 hypothetical protein KVR01_007943 [Diaporthe batatas]
MESVGFVPEPSCGRGTVSIIWSCLATMFFVVWTVLHMDYRESPSKLIWGASTFFMPEAMPAAAIQQLILSRRLQRQLHKMGGWDSWALEQSFLVIKNGVKDRSSGEIVTADRLIQLAAREQHKSKHGDGEGDGVGIHMGMLPQKDDMDKRSKKGWFEKTIAGGQALWFSANVVSRLAGGYQVTLLEDLTLAYACCGLMAMVAWFRCPQDIQDPFEVDVAGLRALVEEEEGGTRSPPGLRVVGNRCLSWLVMVSLSMVTAVHLGAWQYPFPTAAEAWVWRTCALVKLPVGLVLLCFRHHSRIVWLVSISVFVVARVALWAVAFAAFRKMPASAFDSPSWCDYWGHVGR